MHLEAMFVLVGLLRHPCKFTSLKELLCDLSIDNEVADWSFVFRAIRQGTFGQVDVMRWTYKEDSFAAGMMILVV